MNGLRSLGVLIHAPVRGGDEDFSIAPSATAPHPGAARSAHSKTAHLERVVLSYKAVFIIDFSKVCRWFRAGKPLAVIHSENEYPPPKIGGAAPSAAPRLLRVHELETLPGGRIAYESGAAAVGVASAVVLALGHTGGVVGRIAGLAVRRHVREAPRRNPTG